MPSQVRDSRVCRWCFTLNNYSDEEVSFISQVAQDAAVFKYFIFGREVGEAGTPHLQGFFITQVSQRLSAVRRLVSPRAHYATARGTSVQNRDYCSKDGNFTEFGTISRQGQRVDLDSIIAAIRERFPNRPPTSPELAREFPSAYVRYSRLVRALFIASPPPVLRVGTPRQWQQELSDELLGPADDRSIVFYVDAEGGKGKSWFVDWFLGNNNERTQIIGAGKYADLAYIVDATKPIVLVDIPRGEMEHGFSYRLVESLKNKRVLSTKYQPLWKFFYENTHVVVFCNEMPNMERMSHDRPVFRTILE